MLRVSGVGAIRSVVWEMKCVIGLEWYSPRTEDLVDIQSNR